MARVWHASIGLVAASAMMAAVAASWVNTNVFDNSESDKWASDMCSTNTTCNATAKRCFWQLRQAQAFVQSLERNESDSLVDRCNDRRQNFDTCALAANLNVTWSSLTGSNVTCDLSFRHGPRSFFPPRGPRPRRTAENVSPLQSTDLSLPSLVSSIRFRPKRALEGVSYPRDLVPGLSLAPSVFRRARDTRHGRRPGPRGGPNGKRSWGSVAEFLENLETEDPAALQNYTLCVLKEEGLVLPDGQVNRTAFQTLATVAFITEPVVATAVKDAMGTCEAASVPNLTDYMKCWATACVGAKMP
ncbi:uncharacterized protein LOC108680226 isoform X2 [Hyalella azteca]|uniref:Uncharacterized protein LOC108680226 isoform X2 n=1 Tax=Hyalella azteca TaxID=294128 RepID=A0A8B7PGR8_HYAAZ|nr:uncharacterized protein LOC108680226 isoform X2 [Hyalella azteca]